MINHRNTKFNRYISELFIDSDHVYSALEILEMSKKKFPNLNKTTVYRNLSVLVDKGIIKPLSLESGITKYESGLKTHHHHLVCTRCSKLIHACIDEKEILKIESSLGTKYDFSVSSHVLEFSGICHNCLDK